MTQPTPSPRRGRPAIIEAQNDPSFDPVTREAIRPREVVRVDVLPDPPSTAVQSQHPSRQANQAALNIEETVMNILREEMGELATRLQNFGVTLNTSMQQEIVDVAITLLSGALEMGGAIRQRY